MSDRVRITEVSPRDGLQNEPSAVPTAAKARLVHALCQTGVDEIEVTSFVSPKWVPQLADSLDLLRVLRDSDLPAASKRPVFSVLVPNSKGMETAAQALDEGCPLEKIAVFTAASETFSQRNANASIQESLDRLRPVVGVARGRGLAVRGYISCAVQCPFEGAIDAGRVANLMLRLLDLGCDEIDLGDTIGQADPDAIIALLGAVEVALLGIEPRPLLTLHLHDTSGQATECVRTALGLGIRSFDGSVAGLGGCPYASTPEAQAPGNVSTEALVRVVHEAGYDTGVDSAVLGAAADVARRTLAAAAEGTGEAGAES